MGTHSPRGRLTFLLDAVIELGSTAVLSQSGGLSMHILRRGPRLGLVFSGVVSLGNCADIGVCDMLEYFLADAETPDAVLIHLNLPVLLSYRHVDMLGNVLKAVADIKADHGGRTQFALILRSDGEPEVERRKQACRLDAMRDGIPAFEDFAEAATALAAFGFRLRFLAR